VLLAGASHDSVESDEAVAVTERSGAALLVASPVGPQLPRGVPRGVPRPFWQAPRLRAADGVLRVQLVAQPGRIAFDCGVAFSARTFNGSAVGPTLAVRGTPPWRSAWVGGLVWYVQRKTPPWITARTGRHTVLTASHLLAVLCFVLF
jgi:hypothetical protein